MLEKLKKFIDLVFGELFHDVLQALRDFLNFDAIFEHTGLGWLSVDF